MGTLSIRECREFIIFQAFSQSVSYDKVLDRLEEYDRLHQNCRIFISAEEKKAMKESYKLFREVEKIIRRGEAFPDYDDPVIMERMKNILSQRLPAISREVFKNETANPAINKANVGRMLAVHARNVSALGRKMMTQKPEIEHEQAMVGKNGITGHSPYDKVVSGEKTYKTHAELIRDKLLQEQNRKMT